MHTRPMPSENQPPQEPAYQDAQNSCFTAGKSCYVSPSAAVDTPGVAWAPDTAVRRTGYDVCPRGTTLQSGGGKKLPNGTCCPTMWQFFVQDKSSQHLTLPHLLWPEMDSPPFWRTALPSAVQGLCQGHALLLHWPAATLVHALILASH